MIVVDTQAVIWVTQEPHRLSKAAGFALVEGRRMGELAIADITLREIAHLVARGRVRVSEPLDVYLRFLESLFHVVPINAEIAYRSMQFGPSYPKDPADMLIGATAIVHRSILVTSDSEIRASGEVNCVW
jgi:PIN domain nuclease of toxin-antitoxin system